MTMTTSAARQLSDGNGLNGGPGTQLGQSAADPVGFFGTTPATQPNTTGNVHTVAAGATTAAYVNTTWDGSLGTTAYTVGDVVAALKKVGLLAL